VARGRGLAEAGAGLEPVTARESSTAPGCLLPGLTPRERNILEFVVAGRTYGEIARALMISEKTVSSHISNLLRKTGAANRVDLARLASGEGPVSGGSA
jgi:DNA-binding CsgD family transcriptional regulator